jgi:hypothetical protein
MVLVRDHVLLLCTERCSLSWRWSVVVVLLVVLMQLMVLDGAPLPLLVLVGIWLKLVSLLAVELLYVVVLVGGRLFLFHVLVGSARQSSCLMCL